MAALVAHDAQRVAAVRRFNRFYTQHLGVLHDGWLQSPFTLAEARVLALQLARFPQTCLRSDRRSSYEQWSLEVALALVNEARCGAPALQAEARSGAARFAAGKGRGGTFGDIE